MFLFVPCSLISSNLQDRMLTKSSLTKHKKGHMKQHIKGFEEEHFPIVFEFFRALGLATGSGRKDMMWPTPFAQELQRKLTYDSVVALRRFCEQHVV